RLAEEIRNPGQAKQARQDIKDIAAADKVQSNMQRSEQAEAARSFLSGNNQIDNSVNKDS
ncbi:hypothetical protein AAEU29_20520, partial [Pseudoalteromonas sp. SSM20]|uniref:hypothetical protein n=1 Tax=Pseudoalteromonas sp. SSM20 TaxID=3139394 RepID=UPI003BAA543A